LVAADLQFTPVDTAASTVVGFPPLVDEGGWTTTRREDGVDLRPADDAFIVFVSGGASGWSANTFTWPRHVSAAGGRLGGGIGGWREHFGSWPSSSATFCKCRRQL
jgi:hypothetical protein